MARKESDKNHQCINFTTNKGEMVQLRWEVNEYRAYIMKRGKFEPMMLGSIKPRSLQEYITKEF